MIRNTLTLLLAGMLAACGGGGSGGSGGGGNPPPSGGTDAQRAQAIIESCGSDIVDVLLGTLDAFAIVPGSTGLPVTLLPIDQNSIPFTADIDNDLQDDLNGSFTFIDGGGQLFMPFTQGQLTGGINALLGLLPTLPDGTRMQIDLASIGAIGLESGGLTVTFFAGIPTSIDGLVNYFVDPCVGVLTFANVSPLSLLGEFPSLSANATIQDGGDALDGTITFDGTNLARVNVSLNGGDPMLFTLDLTSGAVTPLDAG